MQLYNRCTEKFAFWLNNLTSLVCVVSKSTGIKSATEWSFCAGKVMAAG